MWSGIGYDNIFCLWQENLSDEKKIITKKLKL